MDYKLTQLPAPTFQHLLGFLELQDVINTIKISTAAGKVGSKEALWEYLLERDFRQLRAPRHPLSRARQQIDDASHLAESPASAFSVYKQLV